MNFLQIFSAPMGAKAPYPPASPHEDPKRFIRDNQKFRLIIRYNVNGFQNQRQVRLRNFESLCWEELSNHVRQSAEFGESEEFTINFFDSDNLLKIEIENTTSFCDALEDYVDKGSMVLVIDKKDELPALGIVPAVPQETASPATPTADPVFSAAQYVPIACPAAPIIPATPINPATPITPVTLVTSVAPVTPITSVAPVTPIKQESAAIVTAPVLAASTEQIRKRKTVSPAASKPKRKKVTKMSTSMGIATIPEATPSPSAACGEMCKITDGSVHDKILKSLLELRALGIHGASRVQVALLSGYTNSESAGFKKSLSLLSKEQYVNQLKGKMLQLTWEAVQKLPPVRPPASNSAVHTRFCAMLSKGKTGTTKVQSIFNLLTDGKVYSKEAIGNATGYTNIESAGFKKSMSQLGGFGLIIAGKGKNGTVQLSDICFPYGRDRTGGAVATVPSSAPPTPVTSMTATSRGSFTTPESKDTATVTSLPLLTENSTSKTGRVRKPSKRMQESTESLMSEKPEETTSEKRGANEDTATIISFPSLSENSTSKTGRVRKLSKRMQESTESLLSEKPEETTSEKRGANEEHQAVAAKHDDQQNRIDGSTDIRPPKPGSAEEKILNALISWHRLNVTAVPKNQLVLYAGYTNTASKGFSSAFSALSQRGLIRSMKTMVQITDAGLETGTLSKQRNTPSCNVEVHAWICDLLELGQKISKVKCREMFEILSDGRVHTREALMLELGYSNAASKGYSGAVGLMDRYGLIQYPVKGSKGTMQLTDTCFPFGRSC